MLAKHIDTIFYHSHLNMLSYTGKITLVGGGERGQSKGETIQIVSNLSGFADFKVLPINKHINKSYSQLIQIATSAKVLREEQNNTRCFANKTMLA